MRNQGSENAAAYRAAEWHLANHRPFEALSILDSLSPEANPLVHAELLARALLRLNRHSEAAHVVRAAQERGLDSRRLHDLAAEVLLDLGQEPEAERQFAKGAGDAEASLARAWRALTRSRYDEAETHAQHALERSPGHRLATDFLLAIKAIRGDASAHETLVEGWMRHRQQADFMVAAFVARRTGRLEAVAAMIEDGVAHPRPDSEFFFAIVRYYGEAGRPEAGLAALGNVPHELRGHPRMDFIRGMALVQARRFRESLAPLERAALDAPESIEIARYLAWAQFRLGRPVRALRCLFSAMRGTARLAMGMHGR